MKTKLRKYTHAEMKALHPDPPMRDDEWECKCGFRYNDKRHDFCMSCWADRHTGDREWAQLYQTDCRPGGDVANLVHQEMVHG